MNQTQYSKYSYSFMHLLPDASKFDKLSMLSHLKGFIKIMYVCCFNKLLCCTHILVYAKCIKLFSSLACLILNDSLKELVHKSHSLWIRLTVFLFFILCYIIVLVLKVFILICAHMYCLKQHNASKFVTRGKLSHLEWFVKIIGS